MLESGSQAGSCSTILVSGSDLESDSQAGSSTRATHSLAYVQPFISDSDQLKHWRVTHILEPRNATYIQHSISLNFAVNCAHVLDHMSISDGTG